MIAHSTAFPIQLHRFSEYASLVDPNFRLRTSVQAFDVAGKSLLKIHLYNVAYLFTCSYGTAYKLF